MDENNFKVNRWRVVKQTWRTLTFDRKGAADRKS